MPNDMIYSNLEGYIYTGNGYSRANQLLPPIDLTAS